MFDLCRLFTNKRNHAERRFKAVQIEITTACNLACTMCPFPHKGQSWTNHYMSWDTFARLKEIFPFTHHVHLQGWGEPLLHPRLGEIISRVKESTTRVGFTTNGTLLTGEVAGMLIDQGLDTLCISIAGATEGTHGSIRKGSSLKQIFSNILVLQEYKRRRRVKKPYVTVSYILSRHNIHELPQAVGLVADLGVGDMVATHIDFVHNKQTDDDKVFSFFVVNPEYEAFLEKARQEARKHKIILRTYPLRLEEAPCCELNPLQFVLVNYRGDICPCTYLSLPAAKRIFCGQSYNVEQVSFGNIHEESFQEIWEKPGYKMFREPFLKRRNLLKKQVGLSLLSGTDPGKAETACLRLKEEMAKNPLPEPCRICYKAYGI